MSVQDPSAVERHLASHFRAQGIGVPGAGEVRSWRKSIPALARDLCDAGLEKTEVILEHRLPLSSKRTDVIVAGADPRTGAPSYVVVELKQWSSARRWEDSTTLVEVDGAPYRPVLHPSVQVAGYTDYLRDFVRVFADGATTLQGLAYLHNATDLGRRPLGQPRARGRAALHRPGARKAPCSPAGQACARRTGDRGRRPLLVLGHRTVEAAPHGGSQGDPGP